MCGVFRTVREITLHVPSGDTYCEAPIILQLFTATRAAGGGDCEEHDTTISTSRTGTVIDWRKVEFLGDVDDFSVQIYPTPSEDAYTYISGAPTPPVSIERNVLVVPHLENLAPGDRRRLVVSFFDPENCGYFCQNQFTAGCTPATVSIEVIAVEGVNCPSTYDMGYGDAGNGVIGGQRSRDLAGYPGILNAGAPPTIAAGAARFTPGLFEDDGIAVYRPCYPGAWNSAGPQEDGEDGCDETEENRSCDGGSGLTPQFPCYDDFEYDYIKLPGMPLLHSAMTSIIDYERRVVWDSCGEGDCENGVGDNCRGTCRYSAHFEATATVKRTGMRYIFASNNKNVWFWCGDKDDCYWEPQNQRPCGKRCWRCIPCSYQWNSESIPLRTILERSSSGYQAIVNTEVASVRLIEGEPYDIDRTRPRKWTDADSGAYIEFFYDGSQLDRLSMVVHNDETLHLGYNNHDPARPLGSGSSLLAWEHASVLQSVISNREDTPSYSYGWHPDSIEVTQVRDCNSGAVLASYDYGLDSYGDGLVVSKAGRGEGPGAYLQVYARTEDHLNAAIIHKLYQEDQKFEGVVDHYQGESLHDLVHETRLDQQSRYPDLNMTGDPQIYPWFYEFDGNHRRTLLTVQSPRGVKSESHFAVEGSAQDQVDRRRMISAGGQAVTLGTYDYVLVNNAFLMTNHTDIRQNETEVTRSTGGYTAGLITQITYPPATLVGGGASRQTVRYEYGSTRRATKIYRKVNSNEAEVVTALTYDNAGNVLSRVEDEGGLSASWHYEYTSSNRLQRVTDPRGVVTRYVFTPAGALTRKFVQESSDPSPNAVSLEQYAYDAYGRLEFVKRAHATAPIANPEGDLAGVPMPVTRYGYDSFNRMITVTNDHGGLNLTTTYEYDNQDRVKKMSTPGGVITEWTRDGRGRVVTQKLRDASSSIEIVTSYEYDADSNLIRLVSPTEGTTVYEYDGFNRLTKVTRL
ncbi:MAG: RHS repeat protein [Phycisphaerales bacterium]|nr:RHS repeat protein [Phycisphaerales bacterium]